MVFKCGIQRGCVVFKEGVWYLPEGVWYLKRVCGI